MSVAECYPVNMPVRTAEPTAAQEPVTLQEARRQCGIADEFSQQDEFLQSLITAARQQFEADTSIVCYTGSFTLKMTYWPQQEWFDLPDLRPVTSITSITYIDGDGTTQTLATSVYALETSAVKQFVRLKYAQTWPATRGDINGITITFIAGYASVAAIPQRIKQAILLLVDQWFTTRENSGSEDGGRVGRESPAYASLINSLGRKNYP